MVQLMQWPCAQLQYWLRNQWCTVCSFRWVDFNNKITSLHRCQLFCERQGQGHCVLQIIWDDMFGCRSPNLLNLAALSFRPAPLWHDFHLIAQFGQYTSWVSGWCFVIGLLFDELLNEHHQWFGGHVLPFYCKASTMYGWIWARKQSLGSISLFLRSLEWKFNGRKETKLWPHNDLGSGG